jgi:HK97 family phage major capsid protein
MNIAKLIAKYAKSGYGALKDEEKSLLAENVGLMNAEQQAQFAKDAEGAEGEEGETKEEEKEEGEGVDEKALRDLISKGVQEEITGSLEKISTGLVKNFVAGVAEARKKVLSGEASTKNKNADLETSKFLKAILTKDAEAVKAYKQKAVDTDPEDGAKAGLLIPETLVAEVLRIAETEYGVARRDMTYLPFSGPGNTRKIPTLSASVSVNWTDEKVKKTGTQPTFGLVTQTLKKLAAIIPFTEEILEDSAVNLTQLVATLFAEAVAKEEDIQFFRGTGSPWTGIVNNADVNVVDLGAGEDITNVNADDLLDMIDKTPAGALPGSKFYLHRSVMSVIRKLKDDNDQYIYQRPSEGMPGTIWDYPYELVEAMPDKAAGATHQKGMIVFGNLKVACIFGDKQQIRAKVLDQATITDGDGETVINLAEQDMVALRLEERVGYVLALPKALTVLKTGTSS